MVPPGLHPEKHPIQHHREPCERMPVRAKSGGEGPLDRAEGNPLLNVRILQYVAGVVEDIAVAEDTQVNRYSREDQARDCQTRKTLAGHCTVTFRKSELQVDCTTNSDQPASGDHPWSMVNGRCGAVRHQPLTILLRSRSIPPNPPPRARRDEGSGMTLCHNTASLRWAATL